MTRDVERITSLTNERVKAIRALEMRKARKETGFFVVEGAAIIETARESGHHPATLVFKTGTATSGVTHALVEATLKAGGDCLEVSDAVMEKLAAKDNPQAMLGVFRQRWADPPKLPAPRDAVWLALEEIRDPGNLGTIIRTVDATGTAGILLVGTCCDPYSHEAVRASMGSIFAVPPVRMERDAFLAWRAAWKGDVVGTHLAGPEDFRSPDYKRPVLLVMGGEGPGLSDALTRTCTRLVKIPMAGRLDSLNLAVATALTLYHLRGGSLKL